MQYEAENVDIEIQTLLQLPHGNHTHLASDSIANFIEPAHCKPIWLSSKCLPRSRSTDSESSSGTVDISVDSVLQVNGSDIGDVPTQYTVRGLRTVEFPVIGTYVDKRVVPGFTYKVRKLGSNKYLFHGAALKLLSIGMGYGKRLTMEGDSPNLNENYFYSDTHPEGYGFSLCALQARDKFVVYSDDRYRVGTAEVMTVHSHKELSTETSQDRGIIKTLSVFFTCTLRYESDLSILTSQRVELQAIVVCVKAKGSRLAKVECVKEANIGRIGLCTFELA